MSVREYIGARYVPIVVGEWDSTRTYEPLMIVTYQGNSYTSRQYVPAGIEITNESFWALTGNYNAQVEHYREEVKTYNGRITAAQETADKAKTAAEAATTAASNATTAIAEEKKRAETEETKIQSLAETNKTGITHLDAQMAATAESELLTRISNEVANRTEADTSIETSLTALINAKFPIQTSDLDDGAVTAPKIADSAVNAILQGLTIRSFDSGNSNADNDGLLCPSSCKLSGFYVSELQILVITAYQIYKAIVDNASHNMRLPNYVQRPAAIYQISDIGVIIWNSSSNFKTWSGIRIDPEGYIYPNSTVDAADSANMPATITAYLRPYASGESVTPSNAYDAFKSQSGVI